MTLPSHKSHVFQPLDVSYFNPFKTSFKKVRDGSMSRSNYMEPNKITLIKLVDQSLEQLLTKKNQVWM